MGLSSSTQTTGPSAQAMPYLTAGSNALQSAVSANQGNLDNISSGMSNAFSGLLSAAQNGTPATNAASDWATNLLTGSYTPSSSLQGMINDTTNDVTNNVNSQFARAGQSNSSRQLGEVARQTATAENALKYQDYTNWQNRQAQAAQAALSLGNLNNQTYSTLGSLGTTAATTPYLGAQILSSGLGSLWGNSQTTTGSQSLGSSLLGLAGSLGNAAILKSDRRLKTSIERLGAMSDGLGIYAYRYAADGFPMIGVMADEVADLRPQALGPVIGGYQTVNYGAL